MSLETSKQDSWNDVAYALTLGLGHWLTIISIEKVWWTFVAALPGCIKQASKSGFVINTQDNIVLSGMASKNVYFFILKISNL